MLSLTRHGSVRSTLLSTTCSIQLQIRSVKHVAVQYMLSSTRDPSMRSIVLSSTGTHVHAQFNYKHIIVQYMLRDPSVRSTLHVYMYTAFPWNIGHQNFRCYSRVTYVIVTCIAQGQGFMPANWPESEGDSPRTRRKFLSTANDCIGDMATALGENSLYTSAI